MGLAKECGRHVIVSVRPLIRKIASEWKVLFEFTTGLTMRLLATMGHALVLSYTATDRGPRRIASQCLGALQLRDKGCHRVPDTVREQAHDLTSEKYQAFDNNEARIFGNVLQHCLHPALVLVWC